jgi:cytochrome c peroxidase
MPTSRFLRIAFTTAATCIVAPGVLAAEVFEAGHPSLQHWLLPAQPAAPADNQSTPERVELGKMLFFDPRLSGDGNMSCASCHNPALGWSDGLATAKGFKSVVLARATPTVINTGYNFVQMWDGRKASLEDQAKGPMEAAVEMNSDVPRLLGMLSNSPGYRALFAKAYPNEPMDFDTVAKALAAFERTVVSNDSPFDRWVRGDKSAMTAQQVRGFEIFVREDKGNCAACHQAPNFTDNGFHNIGLASYGEPNPDLGRYLHKPLKSMRGAFKTPTLRDIELTAPYFHDGSARSLAEVVNHYVSGGQVKTSLSASMKPLNLDESEKQALVAFMRALTSPAQAVALPRLPTADPIHTTKVGANQ